MEGRRYVNFASYDYLGLSQHPAVAEAAKAAIERFGTSVSASRIVAGERPLHGELERALADFYGVESAIAFVSGHGTNVSTIATLMSPDDLIVRRRLAFDKKIVPRGIDGCENFRLLHVHRDEQVYHAFDLLADFRIDGIRGSPIPSMRKLLDKSSVAQSLDG